MINDVVADSLVKFIVVLFTIVIGQMCCSLDLVENGRMISFALKYELVHSSSEYPDSSFAQLSKAKLCMVSPVIDNYYRQ